MNLLIILIGICITLAISAAVNRRYLKGDPEKIARLRRVYYSLSLKAAGIAFLLGLAFVLYLWFAR